LRGSHIRVLNPHEASRLPYDKYLWYETKNPGAKTTSGLAPCASGASALGAERRGRKRSEEEVKITHRNKLASRPHRRKIGAPSTGRTSSRSRPDPFGGPRFPAQYSLCLGRRRQTVGWHRILTARSGGLCTRLPTRSTQSGGANSSKTVRPCPPLLGTGNRPPTYRQARVPPAPQCATPAASTRCRRRPVPLPGDCSMPPPLRVH
jgi:hypothetical protein